MACAASPDPGLVLPRAQARSRLSFENKLRLVPSDSADRDNFGDKVALVGSRLWVGASSKATQFRSDGGVVYGFEQEGDAWTQRDELDAFDAQPGDSMFGRVLAAEGDTLAISNSYREVGRAQVDLIGRDGDTWAEFAELTEPDPPVGIFGYSLSMSDSTVLVSSTLSFNLGGAVYAFVRGGNDWTLQATLVDPDVPASDIFGSPCFVFGDDAFIGVSDANEVSTVDYFRRQGSTWSKVQVLAASVGTAGDSFGLVIAVDADDLFVGAPDSNELAADAGAVYVFHRDGESWMQTQVLLPWNDPGEAKVHLDFGYSLAADGDLLLIGALREDTAYVFRRDDSGVWQPATKLFNRQMTGGGFGAAVALQGRTAVVSAPLEDGTFPQIQNGAVYIFDLEQDIGETCSTDADCSTGTCVDGVCAQPSGDGGSGGFAGTPSTAGTGDVAAGGAPGSTPSRLAVQPNGCACRIGSASDGSRGRGSALLLASLALGLGVRRSRTAASRSHS